MIGSSNESELVYIPTENPQAMVDAMTDPGILQTPKGKLEQLSRLDLYL